MITVEQRSTHRLNYLASYVLSRNYGNYPGLFDSFFPVTPNNSSSQFEDIQALRNATGSLPNDRTHVFKFSGSYRFDVGVVAGISFTWQSGTPLSEMAGFSSRKPYFLTPRGTAGRTPATWDLNARVAFDLPMEGFLKSRLILDLFHIASQRKPVQFVEERYFDIDQNGNGVGPNPSYGKAYRYQPPMAVRLGLEASF